jgi:hypothetical protein
VEQEISCESDVTTGTPGGSEEKKELVNDKISEVKYMTAEQKV